jgi:DNA-binding transcriptional regulator YhcF (GntR family)
MMSIDFASQTPIYQQIRDQIILSLTSGELKLGDELPSVRAMSEEIGVNMMTVSKGYQMLKDEGILEGDRRKGTKVVDKIISDDRKSKQLKESLTLLLAESHLRGVSNDHIHKEIEGILQSFQG